MVAVPPSSLVHAFDGLAKPLFDLITSSARERGKLGTLRDYLLPRLLGGRIRVGV